MLGNAPEPGEYIWSFDSTLQDTSATFNGTPTNTPTYSSITITGHGSSLSLNAAMNQSVSIVQPFLPLLNQSWTFEAWINLPSITNGIIYPILEQGQPETQDKYLHLVVYGRKLRLGFFNDDLDSGTDLIADRWYHATFAFNSSTRNQSIYLNGVLDGSRQANSTYQGTNGAFYIGVTRLLSITNFFNGLMDQLSFVNRSKSSKEILRDATLTLHFSFDGNSVFDEGPLGINGSIVGSTSFVSGSRGQALQICNVPNSYLSTRGSVLLGRDSQPYSVSIWIKPALIQKSTIIHMSHASDGTGWALPMIALRDAGQLIALSWNHSAVEVTGPIVSTNSWTHVVSTYSPTDGLRLYVNGSLYNASLPFVFQGSGVPNYFFIGSPRALVSSAWFPDILYQYSGAVDELQVYSRELTAGEINVLANPGP